MTVERIRDGEEKGILGREHNGQSEEFRILLAEGEMNAADFVLKASGFFLEAVVEDPWGRVRFWPERAGRVMIILVEVCYLVSSWPWPAYIHTGQACSQVGAGVTGSRYRNAILRFKVVLCVVRSLRFDEHVVRRILAMIRRRLD